MSLDVNISEPEEFNCNELHSSIKQVANDNNITDFEYHVDSICGKGDNYIANIFRVVIRDKEEERAINVIVKTLVNTVRQKTFHDLHKRESDVYNEIIPKFKEVQDILNEEDRVIFPECMFSSTEPGNEVLILEDMKEKGFTMNEKQSRFEQLDLDEVLFVIKDIAKLHALSFVYKTNNHEEFDKMKLGFNDLMFEDKFLNKSKLRNYYSESFKMSVNVVDDNEVRKKLMQIEPKLVQLLRFYTKPRKYSVLCHGDCWINNALFKQLENGKHQLCFLDFQATRYSSPVTDILHFLFLSTNSNFRSKYFTTVIDQYYESLKSFLDLFNLDSAEQYPRDDFEKDIQDYIPFGFIIAMVELRIVTITPEDEAILKGSNIVPGVQSEEIHGESDLFQLRVNDAVTEANMNGTLDELIKKINTNDF